MKKKLIRITTVPQSLEKLLEGQLKFMDDYYEVIAISSNKKEMEKISISEGVRNYSVEMTRKITPLRDLRAVIKLYFIFRKEKPFFVHTHTPKAGIVGMLAAYLARVPNRLHTVAGLPLLESKGKKRRLLEFVEKLTYRLGTKIYPNSYELKNIIINNRFAKIEKINVIANGSSNGIDTDFFNSDYFSDEKNNQMKSTLCLGLSDFVFVFVGRLVSDKGINELVLAFDEFSEKNKNVKLLLVGEKETNLDPLNEKTLESIKKNKNIISVGYQLDVRPYLAISNVFVFPSYREGFPNVVMQAAAMKLPIITTNINGCNEIVKNGINGIIIPSKNVKAIYNEMNRVQLKSSDERKSMGIISRNIMVSKYSRKFFWEKLLEEYKKLEQL